MHIEQHLEQYLSTGEISSELEAALSEPSTRRLAYLSIVNQPIPPFRRLLLRLLEEEIAFREAVWEGKAKGAEVASEGIYHCAFLLSRCGNPADTAALWKVQYLNQDIGEIDVGNFVGAGISETLSFLDKAGDETSQEIARFIRESLDHPKAAEWLNSWETQSLENIRYEWPQD